MNRLAKVCVALLALPAIASAQDWVSTEDGPEEGTYSTYSAQEARDNAGYPPGDAPADWQAPPPDGYAAQGAAPASQQEMFNGFWNGLSAYGEWVWQDPYGWVWFPGDAGFAPYADGNWVYTTEGWTFASDAPYAWAVFHYGRWAALDRGWGWVPGYTWAPAWVSFRSSPEYVGWCPLGPGGAVYDYWPSRAGGWGRRSPWVFVGSGAFGRGPFSRVTVEPHFAETAYHRAAPVPLAYTNQPPRYRDVPYVHHAEPAVVVRAPTPGRAGVAGNTVAIYRPEVARSFPVGSGRPAIAPAAPGPAAPGPSVPGPSVPGPSVPGPSVPGRPWGPAPGSHPSAPAAAPSRPAPSVAPPAQPGRPTYRVPSGTRPQGFSPVLAPAARVAAGAERPHVAVPPLRGQGGGKNASAPTPPQGSPRGDGRR